MSICVCFNVADIYICCSRSCSMGVVYAVSMYACISFFIICNLILLRYGIYQHTRAHARTHARPQAPA